MCYRTGLISQFHWSALQAFEKYYKGILLYNRVKARNVGHSLKAAQEKSQEVPFEIRMSESTRNLIAHLDDYGRFRYLESSYYVFGPKLIELDRGVWEIRRYCRVMNYDFFSPNGDKKNMLDSELARNIKAEKLPYQDFSVVGGALEKIISNNCDPARESLIWQNAYYGRSRRRKVSHPQHVFAENSPLWLHPDILDHVTEYVFLPKEVVDAYNVLNGRDQ